VRLEQLAAVLDTLRATEPGYSLGVTPIEALTGTFNFTLSKTSTWDGDTNAFWGDTSKISKTPITCVILNKTNGAYADSQIYWALGDGGAPHNLKDEPTVNLANNRSGRLYIMLGSTTRNNTSYWDFEEHTCGANSYNGNTTRVDAYGIPMAIRLHSSDGYDNKLGENYHVFYQSRQSLFDEFKNEVPSEFTHLAVMRAPYRIPNPGAGDFRTGGLQEHYWDKYVDTVWSTLGYTRAKPGAYLNGLGDAPQISAGLHRHVMLRPQSDWGNDKYYYQQAPCNFYSYFLHRRSLQRRCYGFPYDDANGWAAYMSHGNCQWLIVAVGQ
jgi:hypothetical protein